MNKNTFYINIDFKNTYVFLLTVFFVICASPSYSQVSKRVYFVGNSITDTLQYEGLKKLAESQGNQLIWGRHIIPGSPLEWLWQHPNNGFTKQPYGYPKNGFVNYVWDSISLEPFDRLLANDTKIIEDYVNLAKPHSPNFKLFLYSRWPRNPYGNNPKDPRLTAKVWDDLFIRKYTGRWDGTNETQDYFVTLTQAIHTKYANKTPTFMVPVGQVFQALNAKMAQGKVSGYSSIWDVYVDTIHVNKVGSYIAALTYYSTLFAADSRGLVVPAEYGEIPKPVVSIIQETVWDVVRNEPLAGVGK